MRENRSENSMITSSEARRNVSRKAVGCDGTELKRTKSVAEKQRQVRGIRSKSVQCTATLPEVTKKIEDDVKHSEASDCEKQRRVKCRWKLDQVAILDYRRLISHQTSRKICPPRWLGRDARGRHATHRPHQYSSAFLTSSRGVPPSSSSVFQLVGFRSSSSSAEHHGYSKPQQTFRNCFPGINWI